ncbi:AbrB/MazE/SpoVT family DNA-binding domain-containing protein [Paenibacillus polymyxa]|uniref:AbrB/MazE/SpoVT family DNA-binding domain-containing protein n=1 Tax=Paenibacillus polymyxa TaxID=1406 RepID=A0A8I1J6Q0_PAEPO|nr:MULTISPECIES: AbrB/MazE/SpoVT family DNA-binding domain-containing protein [Paenibacillus]KAF6575711.1 AbrB/MazE/SpoVT family DNA-binding domain-containing protein [Paenibacillus sp. EKM206P]KAF6589343.1 AbrB/MazE/SpoVT family DNA-binding domain-containing protein [Paenibacillus sp. EKM205P]MBM0634446.1 AbrB/MazE/SpoVT family DNA-binding domain-containing protein [Paenibacillus polymyxa]
MKNTGMTRSLDSLERIVIPKEMRMSMGIDVGDPIEFYMDIETGFLSMRKYTGVACNLCNADEGLTYFRDSLLCKTCIQELKENIGVSRTPAPMVKKPAQKGKRVHQSSKKLIQRLRELLHEHPHAKQGEYAQWLGVSQGRISQLKKLL